MWIFIGFYQFSQLKQYPFLLTKTILRTTLPVLMSSVDVLGEKMKKTKTYIRLLFCLYMEAAILDLEKDLLMVIYPGRQVSGPLPHIFHKMVGISLYSIPQHGVKWILLKANRTTIPKR